MNQAPTLRAYHNDPALRAATLEQMEEHAAADQIVQGNYWRDGRGCAVGCLTHDPAGGHHLYPVRWGIPEVLARLEDCIFEGLPVAAARTWPVRFLAAIPLGADLAMVWPRFALAMLTDPEHGVLRLTAEGSGPRVAVERVGALLARTVAGETVPREEWQEARAAAYADAAADAYAAAAADADAAKTARTKHYQWMSEKLLDLLESAR